MWTVFEATKTEGRAEGRAEGIEALILDNMESGLTREAILEKLTKRFGLKAERAEEYYEKALKKTLFKQGKGGTI